MFIKNWNNYDYGVYKVNKPALNIWWKKEGKKLFSPKDIKEIRQIAKEFAEKLLVEFVHNLRRGWQNKILAAGRVTNRYGKELTTREEIDSALSNDREIEFHSHRKNGSYNFIRKNCMKAGHLRWD